MGRLIQYNITKKYLIEEYIKNKKTKEQIAKELNCSITPIYNRLKKYNINTQNNNKIHIKFNKFLTKNLLIKKYTQQEKSMDTIAKEFNCNAGTVKRRLINFKIRIRTRSEIRKGKFIGKKASAYIDGRSKKKYFCKDCLKKGIKTEITISSGFYGNGRCKKCNWKYLKEKLVKHHIYMDGNDNKIMKLSSKIHSKLHQKAYEYLVKINLIDNYIKLFDKEYGLK